MRVRLKTQPPLPPLKAWYLLPPPLTAADSYAVPRISQLKADLLHLQGLRDAALSADLLLLSIDGFDLLDETPWDVIKENDLILIQSLPNPVPSAEFQKTKSANEVIGSTPYPNPKKKPHGSDQHTLIALPTSSALGLGKRKRRLSSLSSSDSDPSDASSTSSSSSSSSSRSSSVSSSSAPSVHVSRPKDLVLKTKVGPAISFTKILPSDDQEQEESSGAKRTVPPGQGTNKTHERNRRRRDLRRARRSQSEGHAANILPSGRDANDSVHQSSSGPPDDRSLGPAPHSLSATATPLHPSAMTPSYSLKNKNKKKGFRQAMEKTQPMRIVFGDKNGDAAASLVAGDTPTAIDEPRPVPALIPPSQRSDLPANLFITSINVEADLWGPPNEDASGSHPEGVSHPIGSENVEAHGDTNGEVAVFSPADVDWDALDSLWLGLPVVWRLLNGMIVAWQELGIDPATLSPKMMVSLGRVISVDDTSQTVRIADIVRPDAEMIGFGYGAVSDDAILGEGEFEEIVREIPLSDTKGWRVFRSP